MQPVSIVSVSSQPPKQHVNIEEPAQYARKPPPQQRREAQRRILSVKKRKIADYKLLQTQFGVTHADCHIVMTQRMLICVTLHCILLIGFVIHLYQ